MAAIAALVPPYLTVIAGARTIAASQRNLQVAAFVKA
jgi:hypothetical protein